MIAGFEQPDEGHILLEGQPVEDVPPYRRNVNTVFQSYALFEHLSLFENIAFGLRRKKVAKPEITRRVGEMLELVRLPTAPRPSRASSRAASASASRSHARSSTSPPCCCSTSRSARSTCSCARRCSSS